MRVSTDILATFLSAFGLILVALIPLIWNSYTARKAIQNVESHLPRNGTRMWQALYDIRDRLGNIEEVLGRHLDDHEEGRI